MYIITFCSNNESFPSQNVGPYLVKKTEALFPSPWEGIGSGLVSRSSGPNRSELACGYNVAATAFRPMGISGMKLQNN
ncbi:hypothetical protein POUND7_003143 [Theobroma cacao]